MSSKGTKRPRPKSDDSADNSTNTQAKIPKKNHQKFDKDLDKKKRDEEIQRKDSQIKKLTEKLQASKYKIKRQNDMIETLEQAWLDKTNELDVNQDKILEMLKCKVCYDVLTHPLALPCAHTFCLQCIAKSCRSNYQDSIDCPVCRFKIEFPRGVLSKLPKNYLVLELMETVGLKDRVLNQEQIDVILTDTKQRQHPTESPNEPVSYDLESSSSDETSSDEETSSDDSSDDSEDFFSSDESSDYRFWLSL